MRSTALPSPRSVRLVTFLHRKRLSMLRFIEPGLALTTTPSAKTISVFDLGFTVSTSHSDACLSTITLLAPESNAACRHLVALVGFHPNDDAFTVSSAPCAANANATAADAIVVLIM